MTTHAPQESFAGTLGIPAGEETASLPLSFSATEANAISLLDSRTASRLLAPGLALRGPHLELEGDQGAMLLALPDAITYVGRGADARIRIEDQRVSRNHAILVRHGRHIRLLDNRSANGTYVNDCRIVSLTLHHGDVIGLGPVTMKYVEVA